MPHHHDRTDRRFRNFLRTVLFVFLCLFGIVGVVAALFLLGYRKHKIKKPGTTRFDAWQTPACQPMSPHLYRRPDPLIYSQQYLMSQGLAVTWSNPDVTIKDSGGNVVNSYDLHPATEYSVFANVWNGSTSAPIGSLPVRFSFLSFGIGAAKNSIGATTVALPVKGPGTPAVALMKWTTPAEPGHYCLLIELIWKDDANPFNNVGQHNTVVKPLNSPHATFTFDVFNNNRERQVVQLTADAYEIPPLPSCPPDTTPTPRARTTSILATHGASAFPIPGGWTVDVQPSVLALAPGQHQTITVEVTAPDGFAGRKSFNINGFAGKQLLGGVTVTVTG